MLAHRSLQTATLAFLALTGALAPVAAAQVFHEPLDPATSLPVVSIGRTIALDGDQLAIGAPNADLGQGNRGVVYLYERQGGAWVQTQELFGEQQVGGRFGSEIAISGEWMAIASDDEYDQAEASNGVIRVYRRVGPDWVFRQRLYPPSSTFFGEYGASLDLMGNVLAVGAPETFAPGASDAGAVHLFRQSGGVWVFEQSIQGLEESERIGASLTLGTDRLAVAGSFEPVVRTYTYDPSTSWTFEGNVDVPGVGIGDPPALDLDGDTLVAAYRNTDGAQPNSGSVQVHVWNSTTWVMSGDLSAPDGLETGDVWDVQISGPRIVFGDRRAPDASGQLDGAGAAYLFERRASGWTFAARLEQPTPQVDGSFGEGLGFQGSTLVVGAPTKFPYSTGGAAVFDLPLGTSAYGHCGVGAGPCGNASRVAGCTNSTGVGATLYASGSSSVLADDLELHATGLPQQQLSLLVMGGVEAGATIGDGLLLIEAGAPGLWRFPAMSSASGSVVQGPGLAAFSQATFGASGQIAAGQTWYFQTWFRDPLGPCGGGSNWTNGLSVQFGQ